MKKSSLRFDIITVFPESFSYLKESMFYQAQEKGLVEIKIWNVRDFTHDAHKTVDDRPYGGGPGMVLKFQPLYDALIAAKKDFKTTKRRVILTDLGGELFSQKKAKIFSKERQLIIICGHYEGVDERIKEFVDETISIGKYALTAGELPAMIIADAVSRHIKGFLKNPESLEEIRGNEELVSIPAYTRPEEIKIKGKTLKVPEVLLGGNHKEIDVWRTKHQKKVL